MQTAELANKRMVRLDLWVNSPPPTVALVTLTIQFSKKLFVQYGEETLQHRQTSRLCPHAVL